jgi:uncharacterized protein
LLVLLPLPEAMALHAVTQIASNGWRSLLWLRHIRWRAALAYLVGCAIAFVTWTIWRYVPSKPTAFLLLGVSPFLVGLLPANRKPDPEHFHSGLLYGAVCMTLMLLAGVAGPLIDAYFLGGKLNRREIVATKAVCQVLSHSAKLIYFGGLIGQTSGLDLLMAPLAVTASIVGTSLAKPILELLSETQYRSWARRIITMIAVVYLAQGGYLLLQPALGIHP